MGNMKYSFDSVNPDKKIPTTSSSKIDKGIALQLYFSMLRLRRIEEALVKEYHPADEMKCPVHFCIGQEAVPAALSNLIQQDDYMFSHHRSHGYYIGKNAPLKDLFAELYGKDTGASGGKAGSQDISHTSSRFYSGAILAGAIPIAAGAALTIQNNKKNSVVVCGFGEGATDEGVFWETLNYAALKKLPLVMICENNLYATYSPQTKRSVERNLAERVAMFGLKSLQIFGNDAVEVYQAISQGIKLAKEGNGPVFIEAYTYRWNAHVGPENDDVVGYRPQEELAFWKRHCPVALFQKDLMENQILSNSLIDDYETKIMAEIDDAFTYAKNSKFPDAVDLVSHNLCGKSPLADKLLKDNTDLVMFDPNQAELIPAPY